MENPEEHATKRDQFENYLILSWLKRNIARGDPNSKYTYKTTETFEIGQDHAWLELSLSEARQHRLGSAQIQPGQKYWLHLHMYHNGAPKYPHGVLYTGGLSQKNQAAVIRQLSRKVSDEDVNKRFIWRFVNFDGSLSKLKP